jgi:hypothetical protein
MLSLFVEIRWVIGARATAPIRIEFAALLDARDEHHSSATSHARRDVDRLQMIGENLVELRNDPPVSVESAASELYSASRSAALFIGVTSDHSRRYFKRRYFTPP